MPTTEPALPKSLETLYVNRFSQDGEAHSTGWSCRPGPGPRAIGCSVPVRWSRGPATPRPKPRWTASRCSVHHGASLRCKANTSGPAPPGCWPPACSTTAHGRSTRPTPWPRPPYTLLDLGLRYATRLGGAWTTWRLNVDNVANKAYWQTSANYLTQGAPRVVKLSARIDF